MADHPAQPAPVPATLTLSCGEHSPSVIPEGAQAEGPPSLLPLRKGHASSALTASTGAEAFVGGCVHGCRDRHGY